MDTTQKEIGHLCITRTEGERVFIGDDITVQVVRVHEKKARLFICAPKDVRILREEIATPAAEETTPTLPAKESA